MATPQDRLDSLSDLFDPPPPPQRPRRAPAAPTPAAPRPAPSNPYGAFDALTEGRWSIGDADKVKGWYRQTYDRDLPVTAAGQSGTHDRMGLDHSDSLDVGLSPASEEGKALREYLRSQSMPFLAYDRAVPGAATAAHIHVGFPSHRGGAGEAERLGSITDLFDAPDSHLDSISDLFDASRADEYGEPERINARPNTAPRSSLPSLGQSPTPDVRTQEGRAQRDARTAGEADPRARLTLDVPLPVGKVDWSEVTSGDSARAVVREFAKRRNIPNAFVDRWLAENTDRQGLHLYDSATGERKEPTDYVFEGSPAYDFEKRTLRVSAEMPHLKQLERDYLASRGTLTKLKDWAESDQESPGEKFLDVVTPPAQFAVEKGGRALDIATRPLQAIDAGFWSKVRGADNVLAVKTAYDQFFGDQPELGKNVIAEALRHSERLRAINPRLPALLGELANIIVEPSNLIPVGAVAKGAKVLRGAEGAAELGRVGKLVESVGGAAREAGLLDRGLVEARPLGLAAEVAAEAAPAAGLAAEGADAAAAVSRPKLRMASATEGVTGEGLEVGRKSRRIFDQGRPIDYVMDERGNVVKSPAAAGEVKAPAAPGSGKAIDEAGLLRKAREHDLPLEEVRAEAVRQGYSVAPAAEPPIKSAGVPSDKGAPARAFPVDDALHQRSPYYEMDPQEVLSAALEGQRTRMTELRRLEAAAARGVDPKTGAQLSPRGLWRLQGQVEGLRADVANGPALVRESFGEDAAKAFEQHASEGLPTEFTFDPRAGERGAVNVSEVAAGIKRAASKETLLDLANVPRTLKASADLSAPLRQGAIFTLTEPRSAGRAMRAQLRAFASEGSFEQIARDIAFHPDADLARRSGLYFATQEAAQPLARGVVRPLGAREEAFMSRIAGSLPLVRHSERAYTTYLDKLRMEVFSKYADEIRSAATEASREVDPKEFRDIADFVNKATGRGDIGDWGKTGAPALNATFFAPRYVASRFQILNPVTYVRMSPVARRIAVRKMVQFAGTMGATMLLMKGAGADVGVLNPDDPDWLKVKFGNTRYDLTGGVRTEMRFIARFGDAVRRGLAGEKLGRAESPDYIFQRYLRSKLAPIPQTTWDAATGKTFTGQPFSWKRGAVELVTPLMLTDLYDAYQVDGAAGALKTLPAVVGVGTQTYESKSPSGSR